MAEEKSTTQTQDTAEQATEAGDAARDPQLEQQLRDELGRLGQSFVEVVRVAWNSEQRRQLEQNLKTGLNAVATNLEDGFKKVSASPEAKELVDKAEDVAESMADQVRKNEVAQEIGQGLLKGLRSLGAQLDKLTSELQKDAPGSGAQPTAEPPQDVPIENKNPSE